MADEKEPGMKSAYELAMERLDQKEGKQAPVSDEQRAALSKIDDELKAKMAELDIMLTQSLFEARAGGDFGKIEALETEHRADVQKLRDQAEADKERIRAEGR